MPNQVLLTYKSRRNRACLVQTEAGRYVSKDFSYRERYLKEFRVYRLLQDAELPCAQVVLACNNRLLLTELPGKNLVECLERQEAEQIIKWDIWTALVDWIIGFHHITGMIMQDINLRNFLYDEKTKTLYGLDFEDCAEGELFGDAAKLAAHIRIYSPENTPIKQAIANYVLEMFSEKCNYHMDMLHRESKIQEVLLLERRKTEYSVFRAAES